jgi:hypothetical protein
MKKVLNWIKIIGAFILYLIVLIQIRKCIDYYKSQPENAEKKVDNKQFYYLDPRSEKIK